MKILVADESKDNLAKTSAALKKLGHDVLSTANGYDALKSFQAYHPDLVIMDDLMQKMNSYECTRQIRKLNHPDWIPILFLSQTIDDDKITKAVDAGADGHLVKPFSYIALTAKIRSMEKITHLQIQLDETAKRLSVVSSTDELTNAFNRFQFGRSIRERISRSARLHSQFALLFLDLDHFKIINDSYGHYVGDLLLQNVTKRLFSCLRENDFIARMGGDEFAIILEDNDSAATSEEIAANILAILATPYQLEKTELQISASIGIAIYPQDGNTPETLIQNADMAMYFAKDVGRNNFQYFSKDQHEKRRYQLVLENSLKFAVSREEITMTYQPIMDLQTMQMVGMEALAVWDHPTLGNISPEIFIPLAEEFGLIDNIGKYIFNLTFAQAALWFNAGYKHFKLSINLSSRQLLQKTLPNQIRLLLEIAKIPATILEFELTETAAIARSELSEKNIHDIHKLGIGIALDDFGTGYSSINHLKVLPISTIKIDKTFIQQIAHNQNDLMIVRALTQLGKDLGCNVIAEGIETEAQLAILLKNNCPQGQGFFLGKALTATEMTEYLKKNN